MTDSSFLMLPLADRMYVDAELFCGIFGSGDDSDAVMGIFFFFGFGNVVVVRRGCLLGREASTLGFWELFLKGSLGGEIFIVLEIILNDEKSHVAQGSGCGIGVTLGEILDGVINVLREILIQGIEGMGQPTVPDFDGSIIE